MKFIIDDEVIIVPEDINVITMTGQKILGVRNFQALNIFSSYQFEVVHTERSGRSKEEG